MPYALLHDGLAFWRKQTPDSLAVVIEELDASLTYEQLAAWSDGIAARLQALGVAPGDFVGVTGANSLAWVASAFGIMKAGGVVVPYNTRLEPDDLKYLLEFAAPRIVIADTPQTQVIRALTPGIELLGMEDLASYAAGAGPGWQAVRVSSDSLAMVIFTSGSTGRPKGVMISHEQQAAKYYELLLVEPSLGAGSRIFMPLPIHSASGTQWGFTFATTMGATCFFTTGFNPDRAIKTLVSRKITAFMAISMMYEQMARSPDFAAADFSAITFAQAGGMRISDATREGWLAKGVAMRIVYGLTEVGGVGIMPTTAEARAKPNSCGRGMIFMKLRVVAPDGSDAGPNQPGDVLMRGPGMMLGYLHNQKASDEAFIDGWMQTGDVGVIDEDGYFTFMDRRKDVITYKGETIAPSEVESVISQLDGVTEVVVAAVRGAEAAAEPCAWVYAPTSDGDAEIRRHCQTHLAAAKWPRHIVIVSEPLPRMMSGKIDKRKLVEAYEAKHLVPLT